MALFAFLAVCDYPGAVTKVSIPDKKVNVTQSKKKLLEKNFEREKDNFIAQEVFRLLVKRLILDNLTSSLRDHPHETFFTFSIKLVTNHPHERRDKKHPHPQASTHCEGRGLWGCI